MLLETSNGVVMGNIIVARSLRQLSGMLDSQECKLFVNKFLILLDKTPKRPQNKSTLPVGHYGSFVGGIPKVASHHSKASL